MRPLHALMILAVCLLSGPTFAQTTIPLSHPMTGVDAIEVKAAGHTGLYLFDSGWGVSAVTPASAAAIGCAPWGKITGFRATGERVDLQRCDQTELELAPTIRVKRELSVVDLAKYMGPQADRFAGGIGLDAFDGHVVTLSVARNTLTIENQKSLRRIAAAGTEVPIRLVRDSQGAALTVDVGILTRLGTLWLEIDTGNYGPSRIDRHAAALLGLDAAAKGRQRFDAKLTDRIRLGGAAAVGDLIMDGNIGRDSLKSWDVTLDLIHGRGWFLPAP